MRISGTDHSANQINKKNNQQLVNIKWAENSSTYAIGVNKRIVISLLNTRLECLYLVWETMSCGLKIIYPGKWCSIPGNPQNQDKIMKIQGKWMKVMLAQNMQFPGLDVNRLPVLSWNCAEGTINTSPLLQSGIIHVWVQLTEALAQYIQFGQHLPQHCHSSKAYELWNWSPVIPKTLYFFSPIT